MTMDLPSIADQLELHGIAVVDHVLPMDTLVCLRDEALALLQEGEFHPAHIGHGITEQRVSEVRGDRILWLESETMSASQRIYFQHLEELRSGLSDFFRISLPWTELHLAAYPPGSFYARHLDQFRDTGNRIFSVILYLNPDWEPGHGGEFRVHEETRHFDIAPLMGRLVCFRSDMIEHEVLPTVRTRFSVTGWMRRDHPTPVFL